MKLSKIILGFCILIVIISFIPQAAFCQTEKLGIINYTPPKGMKKSAQENVIGFSELNEKTGGFCIITLYGATASSGNPTTDFNSLWDSLAVKNLNAKANPETETQTADGWTIIAGGTAVDSEGVKGAAFLTVISGFGKAVSILAVFNDQSYLDKVTAFVSAIDLDKTSDPVTNTLTTQTATYDTNGKLIIPPPTRQLHVADFAGQWGEDSKRLSTTYVYRSSGAYAGSDNLTFRSKMTITESGGYFNDFYAIQNGKKILEKTNGKISVNDRVFSIIQNSTQKFVIRGWLELPDMTIMILCGPLYDEDIKRHLDNPEQGRNLENVWVRTK